MHLPRLVTLLGILIPLHAHAAGLADIGAFGGETWVHVCTILPYCGEGENGVQIITGIITRTILWSIAGGAIVVILYAAARMASYGGNEEILTKSKKIIFYAVLGLIFATLASTIVNYLFTLTSGIAGS